MEVKITIYVVQACVFSCSVSVQLIAIPWFVALQAPLSMEFPRQEYWSGLPFPTPGYLPYLGIEPTSPVSTALAGGFYTPAPPGKPGIPTRLHQINAYSENLSLGWLCFF